MLHPVQYRAVFLAIYNAYLFDIVENSLVNYADDSALYSLSNKPADRDYVVQSIN